MRTFIALPICATPSLKSVLNDLAVWKRDLKVVDPDHLHLTLNFLGETDEQQIPELAKIVREVAAAEVKQPLTLRGMGAFPRLDHPTVLWAGFQDSSLLIRLNDELATKCEGLGFARERRAFHPHLTLARIRSRAPERLAEYVDARRECDFGTISASEIVLFRSDLQPSGPVYTSLETAQLQASTTRGA